MLSRSSSSNIAMGTPSFHDLKKQASFFFKEKLKTARLVLTHVTPLQLMTEEATDGNTWTPNTQTLGSISKAAFEFEDYSRIVGVLHNRFEKFEKRNWRMAYNSLIVLEHLLTHGPESVSDEFQCDRNVISQMETFQHIDEKGFNWGLAVRRKTEKVLKLLEKGTLLKEERKRARELSRGIQGFGSFSHKSSSSSENGVLQESPVYRKYNSYFNDENNVGDNITVNPDEEIGESASLKPQPRQEKPQVEGSRTSLKENMAPEEEEVKEEEMDPLLGSNNKKEEGCCFIEQEEDDERHPFTEGETKQTVASLLGD